MSKKRIILSGFKMATVGHTAVGLWRHPGNQAYRYKELSYWIETAKTLEAGKFDCLFVADSLGLFDTYEGKPDVALKHGIQTPVNDPLLAVSAMAAATKRLGFATTVSATYEQPYTFARKMTTLDHLTEGRVGWNIVTSGLDSAARNLGLEQQIGHDERYDRADEFMTVVYKLWEGSWEDGAVVMDRAGSVFVDPTKVHYVGHSGKYFTVPDAFLSEPSIQRTPALFQAGASTAGRAFAAKHAEVIFLSDTRPDATRRIVADVRRQASESGRDPQSVKFVSGATVVTGRTDEEALAKYKEYTSHLSIEGTLSRYSGLMQLDFSKMDLDAPIEYVQTDGLRSVLEQFTRGDRTRTWTPRQIAQQLTTSLGGTSIVGSPSTIADKMEQWIEDADVDGFNIGDYMPLQTFPEFIEFVVPELQRRGRVWQSYEGSTLRESIYGAGQVRVRGDHPAASFSWTRCKS